MSEEWMHRWLINATFVLSRWLHLVATTLLVGGTLFFEFVVPLATEDLIREQQLAVFGRARWVFRKVVWISAALLLLTGALAFWQGLQKGQAESFQNVAGPFALSHAVLGVVGIGVAMALSSPNRQPGRPVAWMQINFMLLLVAMFLASASRHARMRMRELNEAEGRPTHQQGAAPNKSSAPKPKTNGSKPKPPATAPSRGPAGAEGSEK